MDETVIVNKLSDKFVKKLITQIAGKENVNMAKPGGKRLTRKVGKHALRLAASQIQVSPQEVKGEPRTPTQSLPDPPPFEPHPLSLGVSFRQLQYALTFKHKETQVSCGIIYYFPGNFTFFDMVLQLVKENKKVLPPLSAYLVNKPFFPNFMDPVPTGHKFAFEEQHEQKATAEDPRTGLKITIDCPRQIFAATKQLTKLTAPPIVPTFPPAPQTLDKEANSMLVRFFNNLCPSIVSPADNCDADDCDHLHSPPTAELVEEQLEKATKSEREHIYAFFITFPQSLRIRFLPAFANIFIRREQTEAIKRLVLDCREFDIDYNLIVDALVRNGSTLLKAIAFINSVFMSK